MRCFGNMLEALRLEKGLSQADLAKEIYVSSGTISKASPHNCVCGLRPIFCPIRAVIKGGNTYSIPALL